MTCHNCEHPLSDHVVIVSKEGTLTQCYSPIHRNYDCLCTRFERDDLRQTPDSQAS